MELRELTRAEEEVMQILWTREPAFVKDILEEFPEPRPAYNTVSTIVRILEQKGFIGHKAYGKTHEYFPIITKEEYAQHGVQSLMEKYFGGSPKKLVSFLVEKEDMKLKELNELLKSLDNNKKK